MAFYGDKDKQAKEAKAIKAAYDKLSDDEKKVIDEAKKAARGLTTKAGQKIPGIGEDTALGIVGRLGAFLAQKMPPEE